MRSIFCAGLILIAAFFARNAKAEACIFSGGNIQCLNDTVTLNDSAFVMQGTDNPTSTAKDAPQGSLYLRTGASGGTLYVKQDSGSSTNWTALISSSPVSSVNTLTGAVVLNTDHIAEDGAPVNLWFTDARAKAACVSDTAYNESTWNAVTDVSPSKNAVRDQIETMLTSIAGKEPGLGNPSVDGYVLSSTTGGSRSWIAPIVSKVYLSGDDANTGSTLADVAGLNTSLVAGTYVFQYWVVYTADATTTGVKFAITSSGATTFMVANTRYAAMGTTIATAAASQAVNGAAGNIHESFSTRTLGAAMGPTISVDAANDYMLAIVEGVISVGGASTLTLQHASEVSATSTVKAGSSLILTRVN